jgi:ligand-binding SRPBCC domain-containing protein
LQLYGRRRGGVCPGEILISMPEIIVETKINAPVEVCFGLVRDQRIQAEPWPIVTGEFGLGQTVTFEGARFGLRRHLTVEVVEFETPRLLVDKMIEGNFRSFKHIHEFIDDDFGTLMRDTLTWTLPFGILGSLVDKLVLEHYLGSLVSTRNAKLKQIAES